MREPDSSLRTILVSIQDGVRVVSEFRFSLCLSEISMLVW
jgi:hypothetical protein